MRRTAHLVPGGVGRVAELVAHRVRGAPDPGLFLLRAPGILAPPARQRAGGVAGSSVAGTPVARIAGATLRAGVGEAPVAVGAPLEEYPGNADANHRDRDGVVPERIRHARAGAAGAIRDVRCGVVGCTGDRVAGLFLEAARAQSLAELVDVVAHSVTRGLDLPLDLLGAPVPLAGLPGFPLLELIHGRNSFAHWTSSLSVSMVRFGLTSISLSSARLFCRSR